MILRAGRYTYEFPRPVMVMGILNVTPDSFWDGGRFMEPANAVAQACKLAAEGAAVIDVGGESSRPGAEPVSETEELRRVLPVIERIRDKVSIPISIDTQKPGVAQAAIRAGASLVNDIAANREDPAMGRLVADTGAGYVLMHMRGTPKTMQDNPQYQDVATDVATFFSTQIARLKNLGVSEEQLILDVGLGFGKSFIHNLVLINQQKQFRKFHRPLLLGASRKSFMGHLLGVAVAERLSAGLACACWGAAAGIALVRTHDVAETVRALRMWEALQNPSACES